MLCLLSITTWNQEGKLGSVRSWWQFHKALSLGPKLISLKVHHCWKWNDHIWTLKWAYTYKTKTLLYFRVYSFKLCCLNWSYVSCQEDSKDNKPFSHHIEAELQRGLQMRLCWNQDSSWFYGWIFSFNLMHYTAAFLSVELMGFECQVSVNNFKEDNNSIFDKLREETIANPSCGQTALIEREVIMVPKTEVLVHAIVTNIVKFDTAQGSSNGLKRKHGCSINGNIPSRKRSKGRKPRMVLRK